ncbi:hypothetical protein DEA8626_04043 [Defluviimonas aquaemixtae]|uniref:Uncharacterized protein n=1 Tax=Albidovulum aquaemixtae TaxID=1542388 RepID=A0A2R8BNI1_9RHOB|nr:hypothetical protein DEA8626_04043 [Defluviimonas aquaemixtae]
MILVHFIRRVLVALVITATVAGSASAANRMVSVD